MEYILCRATGVGGGTHSNINKPNKRKIQTKMLFHLGFVEIISSPHEGVIRGVFP